jgi:7-keto-8-aminopelargonate synthetase-like enzyme
MRQHEMVGELHAAGVVGCAGGDVCESLEATQEEIDAAIKQIASGGVSELMDVVFEERVLQAG